MSLLSLDTETTGVDLRHGAKPFFVTFCDEKGVNTFYEWDVNPLTRQPVIPESDASEIIATLAFGPTLVLQNSKFDVTALKTAGIIENWPWKRTHDTLIAGHLLASNQPHDLTSMSLIYLGINIKPLEDKLKEACKEARRIAKSDYPDWRIAKKGLQEMPSAKESVASFDYWLPRAIAQECNYPDDHPWWTVLKDYSNADSAVTLPLFLAQKKELEKRGLWEIYVERMKVVPVGHDMENCGITLSKRRMNELRDEYKETSAKNARVCINIAKTYGHELELPKNGVNNSLREFCFDVLNLEKVKNPKSKTDAPTLDKNAIRHYLNTLPKSSKPLMFFKTLGDKRSRDTALSYMEGYERFWLPLSEDWYRLHPSLNATGTDTLRWSSSNPNEQNISKKEGFNLRYLFGPAPGREWWSLDYSNLELVIPAYKSGEQVMIELFDNPDDPPYFGSVHLLNCHVLHKEKFEECLKSGESFKTKYKSTLYQCVKNGSFAIQYGAIESSGTADRAFGMAGAQARIQSKFKKISELSKSTIEFANKYGYVETFPDKTVNPNRGYPLLCTRSSWGKILPTVPLSYKIQGTACWVMMKSMIRVHEYHKSINNGKHYFMAIQVHDEMVLDYPYSEGKGNLPKVKKVAALMRLAGDDIGVPLRVGIEYHPNNWSEGESIKC